MMFANKNKRRFILFSVMLCIAILAGTGILTDFPTIPGPGAGSGNSSGSLDWNLQFANPYMLQGADDDLVLNLNIKGDEITVHERPPVNLVLVLDRSGSMSDSGKLDYAKKAANEIISSLRTNDRLGVVAYSTGVQVLYPIQELKNKQTARNVVNTLYPTNSTNLSGGLIEGINQIRSVYNKEYLNRVILLSDGLANAGITSSQQINNISRQASGNGVSITTMGLGASYDENMMTSIAEYGAGNYYFIESPTQIASIFNREFGQLIQTVAKNPRIRLKLEPGVKVKDVGGYEYFEKDGAIEIAPGDLASGQERNILIKFDAPTSRAGKNKLAKAMLEYDDIASGRPITYSQDLDYKITNTKGLVYKNENKEVVARTVSVDAAAELYRAAGDYEAGKKDDARQKLNFSLSRLVQINGSEQRSEDTVEQEAALRDALDEISSNAPAPETEAGKILIKKYKAQSREQQK